MPEKIFENPWHSILKLCPLLSCIYFISFCCGLFLIIWTQYCFPSSIKRKESAPDLYDEYVSLVLVHTHTHTHTHSETWYEVSNIFEITVWHHRPKSHWRLQYQDAGPGRRTTTHEW